VLQHHEPLARELATRAADAQGRIRGLLTGLAESAPGNKRTPTLLANLLELLRFYPKWRYQGLTLQGVIATYVSLRGQLTDQLREINFCRARLGELLNTFKDSTALAGGEGEVTRGRSLLPSGCRSLDDAVQQSLAALKPEEFQALDQQMQAMIRKQFTALVHVCLTSTNLLRNLEHAMQREAEAFAASRLATTNVSEMYLASHASPEQAREDLLTAFDEAAPEIAGPRHGGAPELQLVGLPAGPTGERVRTLAQQALPDVQQVADAHSDDIIFFREVPHVPLSALEQLGPLAFEAYRQLASREHFTPHSRIDVTDWRPIGG
jgi:hypothetical protein